MATDPNQLLAVLLGTVGQGGNTWRQAETDAQQSQEADDQHALALQQQTLGNQQIVANQQAVADQAQYGNDVSNWIANGADGQGLSNLIAIYPKQWQALQQTWKIRDAAVAQSDLKSLGAVYNALDTGSPDVALSELKARRAAEVARGIDTTELDQHIQQLESGDPTTAAAVKGWARANIAAASGALGDSSLAKSVGVDVDGSRYKVVPGQGALDTRTGSYVPGAFDAGTGGAGGTSGGAAGARDTSRLLNTDAGGGNIPDSVQTIGQFIGYGKALNAKGAKSSSAGTYQINGTTMAQFAPQALGDDWQSQPFNAATQDKVGEAIFNWAKAQPDPAKALAGRWVSLSPAKAAQLVKGSWNDAKATIAQGETGGGAGSSANDATAAGSVGAPQRPLVARFGKAPAGYRWRTDGTAEPIPGGPKDPNAGGDGARLDDDTKQTLAEQYLAGDPSVFQNLGRGAQGAANVVALRKTVTQMAHDRGLNGRDIANIMQDFKMHQKGLNDFAVGPDGRTTQSLNVGIDHLDTLQNAAQALQNGDTRIFNQVRQSWARATGSPLPTNFEAVRKVVAGEVAKVVAGAGGSALADRQDLAEGAATSNSPQQLAGYIAEMKQLLAGKLHGLNYQYQTSTGRNDFMNKLSPRTRYVLGDRQGAPQAAPVRVSSPAQARALAPGTTFITPDNRVFTR